MENASARATVGTSAFPAALGMVKRTLWTVGGFTFFINLLALTSSVYMLQVYDRVLASRSLPTLAYLTLLAAACLVTLGVLEVVRSRLLVRMGLCFDARLATLAFSQTLDSQPSAQLLRDVEQLRTFFSGPTTLSLLDAPWMPVFLALVYVLHPWLGHVALAGAVTLVALALINEATTRSALASSATAMARSTRFAETTARNAEVVKALGMTEALTQRWRQNHDEGLGLQALASDRAANVSAAAKAIRIFLQIAILGVGAWLVILQQLSAGVMIAASIVMGRALAPVESAIGSWRGFVQAREAYKRLREGLGKAGGDSSRMALPRPEGRLQLQQISFGLPGQRSPLLQNVSFDLMPGSVLGVTGPSGSGKSTLARIALGLWRPTSGAARLDGADLSDWPRESLGPSIGYLPQDVEIFPGTVADNISRFTSPQADAIVDAAKLAGAHEMILGLPKGYDTELGPGGTNLSGGQRQRIGLARALLGEPSLVVLDEPTSSLDADGEASVRHVLGQLKSRGRAVLVIAHRPALLAATDEMMVLVGGRIASKGKTSDLMPHITRPAAPSNSDLPAISNRS